MKRLYLYKFAFYFWFVDYGFACLGDLPLELLELFTV